jgi:hypothetical protein
MMKNKVLSLVLTGSIIITGTSMIQAQDKDMVIPISAPSTIFGDFMDHWAFDYLVNLENEGILDATWEENFDPSTPVSAQEYLDFLNILFDFTTEVSFKEDSLLKALYDDADAEKFTGPIGRMQAAQLIDEAFNAKKLSVFTTLMFPVFEDTETLTPEETSALSFVFNTGIMKGVSATHFNPDSPLTKAELAIVLNNTMNVLKFAEPIETNEDLYEDEEEQTLSYTGIISEIDYDEENNIEKILVGNNGDETQPYDKAYFLITDETALIYNTLDATTLEEGQIVIIDFKDGPVAMIYPVRHKADVIQVINPDSSDTRLNYYEEYDLLKEQIKTLLGDLEDEEIKEDYEAQLHAIELTRDSIENKIRRLNLILHTLQN